MVDIKPLTPVEERVPAVYDRHHIRNGCGLTLATLIAELPDLEEGEVRRTLDRMVGKGFLTVFPEVSDYYILTRDGELFFNPLA